jgi:Na+/proline symporter
MNKHLLISGIIILSSFLITKFLNDKYSFIKLTGFLLFYYFLIVLFSWLAMKYLKNGKLIGSIVGFILSIILWNIFGHYALK